MKQRGCENLTVDQLVKDVTPIGRAMVPDRRVLGSPVASGSHFLKAEWSR